jgi:hypothetical protein
MINFQKANGMKVFVEYDFAPGSETTYSPMSGACGGDPCEVTITSVWPDTDFFEDLCETTNILADERPFLWRTRRGAVRLLMKFMEWRCRLTDDEWEAAEAYIAEHHVDDDDYCEDYR